MLKCILVASTLLASFYVLAANGLPACEKINSDKELSFYLIDRKGFLSDSVINMGNIMIEEKSSENQIIIDTGYSVILNDRNAEYVDTCGQGICIKMKKIGNACDKGVRFKVQLAIALKPRRDFVSPYNLENSVGGGYRFVGGRMGYEQDAEQKFQMKFIGQIISGRK